MGQRAPLSIVLDWHKTLDLGYDSHRGVWGERTLQAFRQLNQAHRPLVFRVLSFTGRQQAEAHRQEAFNALPSLERGAGITISSFDQCFERINRGGKAELLARPRGNSREHTISWTTTGTSSESPGKQGARPSSFRRPGATTRRATSSTPSAR